MTLKRVPYLIKPVGIRYNCNLVYKTYTCLWTVLLLWTPIQQGWAILDDCIAISFLNFLWVPKKFLWVGGGWLESEFSDRLWLELSLGQDEQNLKFDKIVQSFINFVVRSLKLEIKEIQARLALDLKK